MARKPKAETHLDEPALAPVAAPEATPRPAPEGTPEVTSFPPPPETAWKWPHTTESRDLLMRFSLQEQADNSHKQARAQEQKERIEGEKQNAVKEYNALISAQEELLSKLSAVVRAGGERRPIKCTWIFEVSGRDDTGAWIPNSEFKTLVRNDTGEVVVATLITAADRQANLELPTDESTLTELEEQLHVCGCRVDLLDPVPEGRTPFQLVVVASGESGDIEGADSRLQAVRQAVRIIEETLAAENGDKPPLPEPDLSFDDDPPDSPLAEITEDGRAARRAGKGRNTAPYPAGSLERQSWKEGWDEADSHELIPLKS